MEEEDFMEMMERIAMDLGRAKLKRDATQQAVECMVDRVGRFNGNRVPFYLESYNVEMMTRDVDEVMRQ